MRHPSTKTINVTSQQLQEVAQRAKDALSAEDADVIVNVFDYVESLSTLIQQKNMSIKRLKALIFGSSTEKTASVVGDSANEASQELTSEGQQTQTPSDGSESEKAESEVSDSDPASKPPPKRRKGHGRNGADRYAGAKRITVPHESLSAGDSCPVCELGTVYEKAPNIIIRVTGQAPLGAKRFELQKLRCHLCGKVFTARLPESAGPDKYDVTAAVMIALLKYGSALPFNRLQGLQRNLEIPLPTSTQWDIIDSHAPGLMPVLVELHRQAAQWDVLYNDDTIVKILELMGERLRKSDNDSSRTGLYTTGVVATRNGKRIVLFFSGRQHAGENLTDVLKQRAGELDAPIQMCDALSRNLPSELTTVVANCLAHARRQFVDVHDLFPEHCRTVLETLGIVYHNDALARAEGMTAEQRLEYHQEHSQHVMVTLHEWMRRQFDDRLVEPNSALGTAIKYMLKHWQKLTLFLRQAGAPLDNNICERALKKAVLHRKNSLFFKTQNGARIGDLYMSLIHTCEVNRVNPFDYLVTLLKNSPAVEAFPQRWMPWNYHDNVQSAHLN